MLESIDVMHLSMVCPRMGGAGNPREFDFVKLYQGRDFGIHNGPLAGWEIGLGCHLGRWRGSGNEWSAILEIPRSHLDELHTFFAWPFFS